MTRAGKEPAEDVKRAFTRAIAATGLEVQWVKMFRGGLEGRFIMGTARPPGWTQEAPAVELHAQVGFNGQISVVEIRCAATDDDRLMNTLVAPTVRNCHCTLEDLPETLQAVWAERQVVMEQTKGGSFKSRFEGRWLWEAPEASM